MSAKVPFIFRICIAPVVCLLLSVPVTHAQTIESPRIVKLSTDRGSLPSQQQIGLTVHLQMHNQAAFDKVVEQLYTPGSPRYHQWMSNSEMARYAPTAAEVEVVTKELQAHGLSILSVSADSLSIRVRGTAANVESAFQTQLHEFERQGKTFHANVTAAHLMGAAGDLVRGVTGLTDFHMEPQIRRQLDPVTGKPLAKAVPLAQLQSSGGWSSIATNKCFGAPVTVSLTTEGASLPVGKYTGNSYNLDAAELCSWTPAQMQSHYGLKEAYNKGLDGSGQTIVIVDGPADGIQLTTDLTQFASMSGLSAITSSNFQVVYPDGQPNASQLEEGVSEAWPIEAALDVEWAHALAPGAKIVVEIMPTDDPTELELAIDYARLNQLGNVISNSYGYPEFDYSAATVNGFEQVLESAAAAGIAVNFASGDHGDSGVGSPDAGGALYPSTSAFVTAVGGTSIGVPDGSSAGAEVGWGESLAMIAGGPTAILDPPMSEGFQSGTGGGVSTMIAKPSWEAGLPGTMRQAPDIAAVADPLTGVVLVAEGHAIPGIGGTSLSSPVFSAIWAIADQKAGKSLGQAAPMLATLPAGAINDVVPVSSPTNVEGTITDSNGTTTYSSDTLLAPLLNTTQYVSALSTIANITLVRSFGTDSSLAIAPGWDNMTGWGVPNGMKFIKAAAKAK